MLSDRRFEYLIHGSSRAQLADALLEYREFVREHSDDPLSATLREVSRQVRIGLRSKRHSLRATGEVGKVNGSIRLAKTQRNKLQRRRRARLRQQM